ncbi:hypothetical protein EDE08_106269 [Bradyrhizobium sp. R2.2-H]|jgi:hypothetical protein|nr:hypothetical protein EDE10_106137 [Bradyrhizobium sp. Y-H1]TCU73209.1 hypothetical protein EDE08_106269 [Bradyrhizobium sp. R2.2-H]
MYRRLWIILLLMIGMTLSAGYVGLIFLPSLLYVWLVAALAFASPVVVVAPVLVGAQIAWPATCVALPVAAMVIRPARAWAPALLSVIGAGSGLISAKLSGRTVGYGTTEDLLWACVFSGALLGALFGYVMWRLDRLSPIEVEAGGSLQTTIRANWLNIALPVVFIVVAISYLALSEPTVQPFLDSNGIKRCTEEGGKLSPREAGLGFRCVHPQRNN